MLLPASRDPLRVIALTPVSAAISRTLKPRPCSATTRSERGATFGLSSTRIWQRKQSLRSYKPGVAPTEFWSSSIQYLAAWWQALEKGTCSGRVFKTAGTAHPPPAPLFVSRTGAQMVGAIRTSTR
jgi:hypothetical protein